MAGIDYYHCAECDVKMLYIHSEEAECDEMYCARCVKQLQAENKRLVSKIKKAIKFIDETPRYHDARDTVIDAIKYNLEQALKE